MTYVRQMFRAAWMAATIASLGAWAESAKADEHECPSHPEATYTLTGDPDSDESLIGRLVDAAKEKGAVCIAAFYDGSSNSKMLAYRRANWVMGKFSDKGVSSGSITRILRVTDKSSARMVQIVLGP